MNSIETKPDASAGPVLVSDLDGTLCRTDTMHEALLLLVTARPLDLLRVPGWVARGKVEFKDELASRITLDAETLPLNADVIDLLKKARSEGRRTALVSASDHRQVTAIAEATGLFDEAYGSAEGRNLKGKAKADFLTERYGAKGYDYIGDATVDIPVWEEANTAITVGAKASLKAAAEEVNPNTSHIAPPEGKLRSVLRALRPHQWSKNMLLFLPLVAAHDFSNLLVVVLAFIAFCLTASSVYVINDLIDLPVDRIHPRKRQRPFASGHLSAVDGAGLAAGLLFLALLFGLATGQPAFLAVLAIYFVTTFAYSLWLKRKLIIDVLMLAGLYTIRIIAGGAAGAINLSPWMLGFSMFLFLGLAAVKRQAELMDQMVTGRTSSGRAYEVEDLPVLRGIALTAGQASILVLALYISSNVVTLYAFPSLLWLICPALLYWFLRMVMKTHRGEMTDDPIVFAAKDKISLLIVALCGLLGFLAAVWPWYVPQV